MQTAHCTEHTEMIDFTEKLPRQKKMGPVASLVLWERCIGGRGWRRLQTEFQPPPTPPAALPPPPAANGSRRSWTRHFSLSDCSQLSQGLLPLLLAACKHHLPLVPLLISFLAFNYDEPPQSKMHMERILANASGFRETCQHFMSFVHFSDWGSYMKMIIRL